MPGQEVSDHAAEHRAQHTAHGEDRDDGSLASPAPVRWHEVADDDLRQRQQPACAQALQAAKGDQLK
jgi:hypothetical protein